MHERFLNILILLLVMITGACGSVSPDKAGDEQPRHEQQNEPSAKPAKQEPAPLAPPTRGILENAANPPALQADSPQPPSDEPMDDADWNVPLGTFRKYLQSAEYPHPPDIRAARQVTVSTMEGLQNAIASNTVVTVTGELRATNETCVGIGQNVHDLIIRFDDGALIRYAGPQTYSGMLHLDPTVRRIRIESPHIVGPKDTLQTCAGIEFEYDERPIVAEDVVITDGQFEGLNYAIQCHGGCRRLLVQNCAADELIDYFFYGSKVVEDVTIQQCVAHGIVGNHVIRMFDANRVNIFRNDLKVGHVQEGQMKRTIWILTGQYITIAANHTRDGRVTLGPNPVVNESSPDDRVGFVNIVYNRINHTHTNTPIELLSGAHDMFLTGNVVTTFTDHWLGIGGWNTHQRPITKIHWTDGTMLNGKEMHGREGVAVNEHYADQPDIAPVNAPEDR